jgi:hypothetical protein
MSNSQAICDLAVRDRILSIIHNAAERADISLEVCFNEASDGTTSFNLVMTSRSVPLPGGQTVNEVLRAVQDQTELFLHDVRDMEQELKNVKVADTQTGIYLAQAGNEILFASTCQADTEDYLAEHADLLDAEQTFVPLALEEIPQTLYELAVQHVEVPEFRTRNLTHI